MSGDQDIAYTSATSLLDLYRKRALSPVEVTSLLLDRLDALQPKINAFCGSCAVKTPDESGTGCQSALSISVPRTMAACSGTE